MTALLVELNEISGRAENSAAVRLKEMAEAYWLARGLHLAVKLGLPDLLAGGSRRVPELAASAGADPAKLARLLGALARAGILQELRPGLYTTTPFARNLEEGRHGGLRDFVLREFGEEREASWERFEAAIALGA
jgi:hypothetical protein